MDCTHHYKANSNRCSWCSKKICEMCIDEADGNKLCPECHVKLRRSVKIKKKILEIKTVKNIDPKLSEERIKEGKDLLEGNKSSSKKRKSEDVPKWPKLME